MRRIVRGLGLLLGLYLIVRAVAQPFVIDLNDPATYQSDWGGPSLAGVLLVHCGPGVVSALLIGLWVRAQWRRRTAREARSGGPTD
jgi:hypothetical protein